jgi:hypothetical protein
MASNPFTDKAKKPTEDDLAAELGRTKKLWNQLRAHAAQQPAPPTEEWKHSGVKYGWSLVLHAKKRNVLYMAPREGYFMANLALNEKAVIAAADAGLPPAILDAIRTAPKYAEGRPVRIEVRAAKDLDVVKRLLVLKMSC